MNGRLLIGTMLGAAILFSSAPTQAVVLFSFPPDPQRPGMGAGGSWYDVVDNELGYQAFADAYFEAGTVISDFHWWGRSGTFSLDGLHGFQFEIWTNDATAGKPSTVAYSEYFAGHAGASEWGGLANYAYGIDLSSSFEVTTSGYYWFSVVAHTEDWWGWSKDIDLTYVYNTDWSYSPTRGWEQGTGATIGLGDNHFEITGEPIPEPGTLMLVGLGLAGLAYRRRRANH